MARRAERTNETAACRFRLFYSQCYYLARAKMPPMVRPRRTSAVALPAGGAPLPGPGRRVPLSPFDAYWVALPPLRRVFLYRSRLPFTDVVSALRSSLERLLPAFHPFAGALTYSPEPLALSIVLPTGEGACSVAFVEAETDLDFDLLAEGEEFHEDALRQLSPDIRRDELPAPVMAVQVTEFGGGGGGVAVGVALHHSAADGRGLWRFMEMWSATAARAMEGQLWAGPEPLHDRSLVRFHGDDDLARLFLQQLAPDFPRVARKQDAAPEQGRTLSRRTFTFAASAVRRLKQRLAAAADTATSPSTFAAITAHGWVSIARARGLTDDAPVFAAFLADCRAHMLVPAAYIGNCVALGTASLKGSELAGPNGPAMALLALQEAVAEVKRDPLADRAQWCTRFAAIPRGRAVILAGSPWFPAYGVDFGFGRPARVELASMKDSEMALVAGTEPGSVQASVAIAADKMPAFRGIFELEFDRAISVSVPESE